MAQGKVTVEAYISKDDKSPDQGVLTFVDNTVDPTTGTIKLKATFPNAQRKLWPGQFVNVALTLTTQPNALLVPTSAIQTGQSGQFVFVVKNDNTVESRPVVAGRAIGDETVIDKGVNPGETVVTDGQVRLVPGAKVEIRNNAGKQGGASPAPTTGTSNHEHRRTLYSQADHDLPGHARHLHLRHRRLPVPAGERPPECRLPHDPGDREPARRQPRHHGLGGGDPPGASVLDHRRGRFHDLHQRHRVHPDHHPVQPLPKHRRRGPGRAGRHLPCVASAAAEHARARRLSTRSTRPTSRSSTLP